MKSNNTNISLRKGIIYKYTNKINGNAYIGLTINPESRKNDHLNRKKKNTGLDIAIAKYGSESFDYEVLYETEILSVNKVKEILNEKEIYFIEKYDTYNNGYNLTKGGNGTVGFPCSEKTKEFIKYYNAHRNELMTEETREKLRLNAYNTYNKRYTPETCKKMSDANRYILKSELSINKMKESLKNTKTRQGVKINFLDGNLLICTFNSRKECEEYFHGKITLGVIKTLLSGKHKCRKYPTYKLIYADGEEHKNSLCGIKNVKKIILLTLDNQYIKTWNSANECKNNGYCESVILRCCKHEKHCFSYKGYKWLFEDDYKKLLNKLNN